MNHWRDEVLWYLAGVIVGILGLLLWQRVVYAEEGHNVYLVTIDNGVYEKTDKGIRVLTPPKDMQVIGVATIKGPAEEKDPIKDRKLGWNKDPIYSYSPKEKERSIIYQSINTKIHADRYSTVPPISIGVPQKTQEPINAEVTTRFEDGSIYNAGNPKQDERIETTIRVA